MAPHTHKRTIRDSKYYQPQITNFFSGNSPSFTLNAPKPLPPSSAPYHLTQQNLLQVGMRVRKSVLEGYKLTSPTPSAYNYTKAGAGVREAYYNNDQDNVVSSQDSGSSAESWASSQERKRKNEDSDEDMKDEEGNEEKESPLARPILSGKRRSKGQMGFFGRVDRRPQGERMDLDEVEDFGEAGFLVGRTEL